MRNPLSAILQSADGIASSLIDFQSSSKTHVISDELVESNLEAVQIITLCAQHQGRIINDVLTLSKLDSAMLLVSPVTVQPSAVVQRTLKMFEGELASSDIKLEFHIEETYRRFEIDWVLVDPSRLTQVSRPFNHDYRMLIEYQIFINLMTNVTSGSSPFTDLS